MRKPLSLRVILEDLEVEEEPRTPEDEAKLRAHGYMELQEEAQGFVCGNCKYADKEYGFCQKIEVPIDQTHGCCNLFYPQWDEPKFK